MMKKRQDNLILRSLAWLVILTQVVSPLAYADIKPLSKAALAPQMISDPTPPGDADNQPDRQEMVRDAVLDSMGRLFFGGHKGGHKVTNLAELVRRLRDEFRSYSAIPGGVHLDTIDLTRGAIHVEYDDPAVPGGCVAVLYPHDHGVSQSFGISMRDKNHFRNELGAQPAPSDEPLIGSGFSKDKLDKVEITSSKAFESLLAKFEADVLPRVPPYIRNRLSTTLKLFKDGEAGRRIGVVSSVCKDKDHYYPAFGTSRSIGIGSEFLDDKDPLSEYALQALFHELYHATFGENSDKEDADDNTVVHYEAMKASAMLFWGMSRDQVDEIIGPRKLKSDKNNKFGVAIRNWKSDHIWINTKDGIRPAIIASDHAFLIDTLKYLLEAPEHNFKKVIELLTIWDEAYRRANGNKQKIQRLITKVTGELDKEEKYRFANLICSPAYHTLYDTNLIVKSILTESQNDVTRQILELKVKEVAGRIKRNPAYLWDREFRGLRERALAILDSPEGITPDAIDELEKAYGLCRQGGLDPDRRARAQELKNRLNLKPGEVACYDSMEYATNESLLFFAGGLGALAGDHAKAGSDLLPAGTLACVGGYYKFGYLSQVIDANRYQRENYERMKIEEWGELVKDEDGRDMVIELPMPDGKTIYTKAWKMEMGRTDLYLMTTDIDENNANPHYRDYLNYTYDDNSECRITQEYVIGVGGERLLSRLGMKTKILHLNEGHVAFTLLEKARQLLIEKIGLLNERTGLGYRIENLGHVAIEERRRYGLTLEQALEAVRHMVVFTSHTPIADGNQVFPYYIAERYIGSYLQTFGGQFSDIAFEPNVHDNDKGRVFNMTEFALTYSNLFNGVSRRHAEVCRKMYEGSNAKVRERFKRQRPQATNVTNAVNREYYQPEEMQELLGQKLAALKLKGLIESEVTLDNISWVDMWKVTNSITDAEMEEVSKRMFENGIRELKAIRNQNLPEGSRVLPTAFDIDPNAFILVFGRRMTGYKRPDFILDKDGDLDPIAWKAVVQEAARRGKKVQIIYTGKAHPNDPDRKAKLQRILHIAEFDDVVKGTILFIENYNTQIAKALVKIASAPLNNPIPPEEASGTSGMKYLLAGKPNISVMDGWVLEAQRDGSFWGVYPFVTRTELKDTLWGDWRFVSRAGETITGRSIGNRVLTHEQEVREGKKVFECLDPQCRHVWTVDAKDPDPGVCPNCGRPAIKNNSYRELGLMDVYFNNRARWCQIMRESLAMGVSYFTSHRMFMEYIEKEYIPTLAASEAAKKEFMAIGLDLPGQAQGASAQVPSAGKGTIRNCLDTIVNSDLIFKTDISTVRDLVPDRKKTSDTAYSLRTVQEEVRILRLLGMLVDGTSPNTSQLRSQIRNLSPPEIGAILSIPQLDRATIPAKDIPALRDRIEKLITGSKAKINGQAAVSMLLSKIASLPMVRDVLKGTPEENLATLKALVMKTNDGGYYYERGEADLSIMVSGELGKFFGLHDKDLPLYYTITASEDGDFSALNALKEATDLARDMSFKNPLSEVFFEGGKSLLYVDGRSYFATTAVYGDKELFDLGYVVAKGGVRVVSAQTTASPENIANVRRAVERYVKAFIDLGTLGVSRIEGPDMRPSYMDVGDIMELIDEIGVQAEKDLNKELIPLTTSGSAAKGYLSHDTWRVTSLSVLESICALLDNGDVIKQFNIPTDKPRTIILQGLGEVGGNIIRLLLEHPDVYKRYNFIIVGVSDLGFGSLYNKDGIPLEELRRLADNMAAASKRGEKFIFNPSEYDVLGKSEIVATSDELRSKGPEDEARASATSKRILFKDAAIAIPAARPYQIETEEDVALLKVKIFASAANAPIGKKTSAPEEVARIERFMLAKGIISQPSWLINYGGIATSKEEILHRLIEGGLVAMLEPSKRQWLKDHVTGGDVVDIAWVNTYWALYLWNKENYAHPLAEIMKERAYRIAAMRKDMLMRDGHATAKLVDKLIKLDSATIMAKARVMLEDLGEDTAHLEHVLSDKGAPLALRRVAAYVLGKSGNEKYELKLLDILEDDKESGVMYRNAAAGLGYILEQSKNGADTINRIRALYDCTKDAASEGNAKERKIWLEWLVKKNSRTGISLTMIESNMSAIHDMNVDLLPPVENGKVLYQVIAEELIPVSLQKQGQIEALARDTERLKMRERIKIVKHEDLQSETARLKSDPNNIVLAAVQHKEDLALLPKGVKALVFTGDDGGAYGFRHIHGIQAALRALYRGDTGALARLYRMLTGAPFAGQESDILKYINDPQALAGIIIFNLEPAAAKDGDELKRLNDRLLEFLYKA